MTKEIPLQAERALRAIVILRAFQLTSEEFGALISQIATSNVRRGRGGRRKLPYAFTEHGGTL
jgi:hypothetical protein